MELETHLSDADLASALDGEWYHTIELAPGVVTPGWFDPRGVVAKLPFPGSLGGKRCLDVATADGFWAFEMERRGASEVYAIDVLDPHAWDWPTSARDETRAALDRRKARGRGFAVARRALGSNVCFEELSVYDLDAARVGEFDFVYMGSLLMHLRDPIRALERVRAVCAGQLLLVDNIDLTTTLLHPRRALGTFDGVGRPWWWRPNAAGLFRMLRSAGFEPQPPPRRVYMPVGPGHPRPGPFRPGMLLKAQERNLALTAVMGDPHAAILAT